MTRTERTYELLKAAAANPNFNPLDASQWEQLLSLAPLIHGSLGAAAEALDEKRQRVG